MFFFFFSVPSVSLLLPLLFNTISWGWGKNYPENKQCLRLPCCFSFFISFFSFFLSFFLSFSLSVHLSPSCANARTHARGKGTVHVFDPNCLTAVCISRPRPSPKMFKTHRLRNCLSQRSSVRARKRSKTHRYHPTPSPYQATRRNPVDKKRTKKKHNSHSAPLLRISSTRATRTNRQTDRRTDSLARNCVFFFVSV